MLERAASEVEAGHLGADRRLDLTVEVGGRQLVRGRRLQPQVRYPVTAAAPGGHLEPGWLGCSVSPR